MSASREEPLLRVQMAWEDYLKLPERPRAEWVDGEAVIMNAPVAFGHGDATAALLVLLRPLFPDRYVVTEVGLWLPRHRLRAPDLMMVASRPEGAFVTDSPVLCAEVLSPATRSEDTVRKSIEYAEGGVGQYWMVDPELRTIRVMRNLDGVWEDVVQLTDDAPSAEVELANVTVPLDLRQLIRS